MTPKQRGAGQTGGHGGQRSNKGTFRNAGGRVPPPPKRPTVSGDGKSNWGCPISVAVPVTVVTLVVIAVCRLI